MRTLKRLVDIAHDSIANVVRDGDNVIDATIGNGNDTAFLARLVGKSGKVYGFDIQQSAIENTKEKLKENELIERVELIKDSHQNVDDYVKNTVSGAMFNLGYLPGGNHSIITEPMSTVYAIENILTLLKVGGIITIIIYYGHEGGTEEKEIVLNFVSSLDNAYFSVQKIEMINHDNNPPILICIEKLK